MNTKTTTEQTFYPQHEPDKPELDEILNEIIEVLRTRTDGLSIRITRTDGFPPHKGKQLIVRVEMEMWDIAA